MNKEEEKLNVIFTTKERPPNLSVAAERAEPVVDTHATEAGVLDEQHAAAGTAEEPTEPTHE